MIADIGLFALILSLALALYATGMALVGAQAKRYAWIASARNAAIIIFPLLTISVLALVYSLLRLDFSLAYVHDVSSSAMSPFLRVTALWGGQEGSILFWAWIMAGYAAAVFLRSWKANRELMPYVLAVAVGTTAFFIGLSVAVSNPFARLWHIAGDTQLTRAVFQPPGAMAYIPREGQGLNPLLRHFGMIGHPPTTYLGFTGFVIPYAYAIAALITGRSNEDAWIRATRRWTIVAWMFLSVGLILGGRWAYDVLGWGGFWGWDPVENAMLMPWLTGTAFLHSVMIQEKRGMLKVWNMVLIILTYSLVMFGTFITRTGVISSVHSFAKSALGPVFFIFISLTFVGSLVVLFRRLDTLKAERPLEGTFSREAVFLLQNVIFLALTFAVFWGTVFPMVSELITGTKITVGPPFFRRVTTPLFLVLVILMAIAPYFAWRQQSPRKLLKSMTPPLVLATLLTAVWAYFYREYPEAFFEMWVLTFVLCAVFHEFALGVRARMRNQGEGPLVALLRLFARNQRRYGGYLVHLGVVFVALGFLGDARFKAETQATLAMGERLAIRNYEIRFDGLEAYQGNDGREVVEASLSLFKDGEYLRRLQPRRDYFVIQRQPVTIPGVYSTLKEDVYVLLVGWEEIGLSGSTYKVYVNPLINWTWLGGVLLTVGALVAVMPGLKKWRAKTYRIPATAGSSIVVEELA